MKKQNLPDTHTFIWFIDGNEALSPTARQEIEAENATNFVSIASIGEMAIKLSLGKLELKIPFHQLSDKLTENGFEMLPVSFEDT